MDDLENLPLSEEEEEEEEETPVQKKVMKKYFGNKGSKSSESGGWKDMSKWKIIGASVAGFLLLSFPMVKSMFEKIPYLGGNSMTEMLASAVFFLIFMMIVVFFL